MGITTHRSAIVKAVAEKMNTMLPGIYDASAYDDEEDDEWFALLRPLEARRVQ